MKGIVPMKQRFVKLVAFALFASFTSSALAAIDTTGVPDKSYSKILTLNVDSDMNITQALAAVSKEVSDLNNASNFDKLVKTGAGTLEMTADISKFGGDIYIEEGTLAVSVAKGLGKDTIDSFVVVRNGTTLKWTYHATFKKKTIYFEGDGYGSNAGALVVESTLSQNANAFTNYVFVMTGNASVLVKDDSSRILPLFNKSSLYMNGNTNTCSFGEHADKSFEFGPIVKDNGVFIITDGLVSLTSALELPADETGVSRIILDGCKVNFYSETYPNVAWPIYIARKPDSFAVQNSASTWPGALEIAAGKTVDYNQSVNTLTFEGGLKGGGTLTVKGGTLALGAANDDFTGTLKATGGTVKLPTQELGVRGGLVSGHSSDIAPMGFAISNEWKNIVSDYLPTLSNQIERLSVDWLTSSVEKPSTTKNHVYTLSGYLMNNSDEAQTWALSANLIFYVDLRINGGASLFGGNKYKEYKKGLRVATATLQPGANRFVLKCWGNDSNDRIGVYNNLKDVAQKKTYYGLGYIVNPEADIATLSDTNSTPVSVWTQLAGDDGEGNIFRYATNSADVVALEEAGLLTRSTATFRNLELSSGVVFQMDGSSAVVSNLTGTGSIVQSAGSLDGNKLVITGDWTIPADDLSEERKLESDVPVRFGDGARIVLDYATAPRGRSVDVLTSDVGIVGALPEVAFADGIARPAEVALSADGKTLSVNVKNNGLIIMWK